MFSLFFFHDSVTEIHQKLRTEKKQVTNCDSLGSGYRGHKLPRRQKDFDIRTRRVSGGDVGITRLTEGQALVTWVNRDHLIKVVATQESYTYA